MQKIIFSELCSCCVPDHILIDTSPVHTLIVVCVHITISPLQLQITALQHAEAACILHLIFKIELKLALMFSCLTTYIQWVASSLLSIQNHELCWPGLHNFSVHNIVRFYNTNTKNIVRNFCCKEEWAKLSPKIFAVFT